MRPVSVGDFDLPFPRCPFTTLGQAAYEHCPGFRRAAMDPLYLPWFRSKQIPLVGGFTCGHLHPQQSRRGAVAACHFPSGLPAGAASVAGTIRDSVPRRQRALRDRHS